MNAKENIINWFEIPVTDLERAVKFYETIFGIEFFLQEMGGMSYAFFPSEPDSGKVSGALARSEMHIPHNDGTKVYFNGQPDLSVPLDKVKAAGGKVTMPKTDIGEGFGFMAFFIDTEGNSIGIHSMK